MILWTIQEEAVYHIIMEKGVYRCAPERIFIPECRYQYDWLVRQMEERIGPSPEGVEYPAWAWYSWEGERKKPDLRKER